MGVTTTKTNKPFNPRAQDQSPKGFNRSKLFSGKALDFDGVNDYVDLDGFTMSGNTATFCFYADVDNDAYVFDINPNRFVFLHNATQGIRVFNTNGWSDYGLIDREDTLFYTIVCDGTSQSVYVNGQKFGDTKTITALDLSTTTLFKLGSNYLGDNTFYNGTLSNYRLFNTALTAAQVADLYNNPEKVVPTGVDNTALKLWLPMMEGAGTYCINGADPLGNDEYNGAGSFDSSTGWTLNTGFSIGSGSLSCNGTQTAATSAYYNISSVASSLVMVQFTLSNVTAGQVQLAFFGASGTTTKWYTANGTYTEYVEVQAGHNGNTGFIANADFVGDIDDLTLKVVNTGAISGATWTHGVGAPIAQTAVIDWNKETTGAGTTMLLPQGLTTGRDITGVNLFENVRKQGALNLDGNSWAEVHDNASLDYSSEVTLETWIYWTGEDDKGILGRWHGPSNKRSLMLYSNTATKIVGIYSSNGSATAGFLTPSQNLAAGNWYHVAFTSDGSTIKIYIDGVEGNSASYSSGFYVSDENLEIATYQNDQAKAHDGQLAQPRIYNRALTAAEIQQNYNAGKNTYTN